MASGTLNPVYAPAPPQATVAQSNAPTGLTQQQLNASQAQTAQSNAATSLTPQQLQQLSPNSTIQQILAAYTPAAQQSQNNLNQSLAAAGVSGGGTVGATQQLQGQLAASLAPSLAGAIQNSQANTLGAEEFGSSQGLQQALTNAGLANSTNQFNAGNNLQAGEFGSSQGLQQALYNAGARNEGNQYNTSNLINTQQGNVSTANNFEQYLAGLQNQDWLAQLGAYTGLNEAGLSGQQGINQSYANNFGIQSGNGLGALTSSLGNLYGQSQPGSVAPVQQQGGFSPESLANP